MQLDHLRYFVELAHAGSFARAAQSLFISPQGLNKAIGAIESELGVSLVMRGNRGTSLTPDGTLFLAYAEEAIERFEAMADDLAARKRAAMGREPFLIGATSYALHTVFEGQLDPVSPRYVRVQEMGPTEIADAVAAGDPRLFVTDLIEGGSLAQRCAKTGVFRPIFSTSFGIICHENYPLSGSSLTVDDVRELPLVCFHDESIDWIMQKYLGGADSGNVLLQSSNSEQLVKYVVSQTAVSLLDSFACFMMGALQMPYANIIRFVPVSGLPRCTTGFFYNPGSPDVERLNLYIDAYMIAFRRQYAAYLRR